MTRILLALVLPALVLPALMLPALSQPASAAVAPDVLYLHGVIASPGCPGIRTAAQAAPLARVLRAVGYTGAVKGVDYECGDSTGLDIKPYGRLPRDQYNANARIEDIAYAFARFVKARYTNRGLSVHVVGHSMGGLVAGYAVKHYGAKIARLVSISTPYGGYDEVPLGFTSETYVTSPAVCGPYTQCKQMARGSSFLTKLASYPRPRTVITTLGGSPKDIFSYRSSSYTAAHHRVNYYASSPVNYTHSAYLTDESMARDVPLKVDGVARTGQPHSLRMAARFLIVR